METSGFERMRTSKTPSSSQGWPVRREIEVAEVGQARVAFAEMATEEPQRLFGHGCWPLSSQHHAIEAMFEPPAQAVTNAVQRGREVAEMAGVAAVG